MNPITGVRCFYLIKVMRDAKRFDRRAHEAKVETFFHKATEKRDLATALAKLSLANI